MVPTATTSDLHDTSVITPTCIMLTYISNTDHYNLVLSRVVSVRKSLWIGTADIKDLYVRAGEGTLPFLAVLAQLVRQAMQQFDEVWMGLHCTKCLRRKYCGDPIA